MHLRPGVRAAYILPMTDTPYRHLDDKKLPTEDDQKIIWVVAPDAVAPGTKTILITTRKAAMREGYTIPKVFLP